MHENARVAGLNLEMAGGKKLHRIISVSVEEISVSAHPSGCSSKDKIILVVLDRLFKPMKGRSLCMLSEIEKGRQIITVAPQNILCSLLSSLHFRANPIASMLL